MPHEQQEYDLSRLDLSAMGQVIKERRQELGISEQELADSTGILDGNEIKAWESGKINDTAPVGYYTMQALANRLDLNLSSMLRGVKEPVTKRETLQKELDGINSSIQSLNEWKNDILLQIAHLSDSRFEVRQTDTKEEPVYCIYDNEKQEYVSGKDGEILTFSDTGKAFEICDQANEKPEQSEQIFSAYEEEQTQKNMPEEKAQIEKKEQNEKTVSESDTEKNQEKENQDEEKQEEYENIPRPGIKRHL